MARIIERFLYARHNAILFRDILFSPPAAGRTFHMPARYFDGGGKVLLSGYAFAWYGQNSTIRPAFATVG
jgi:hypothetical protein